MVALASATRPRPWEAKNLQRRPESASHAPSLGVLGDRKVDSSAARRVMTGWRPRRVRLGERARREDTGGRARGQAIPVAVGPLSPAAEHESRACSCHGRVF